MTKWIVVISSPTIKIIYIAKGDTENDAVASAIDSFNYVYHNIRISNLNVVGMVDHEI